MEKDDNKESIGEKILDNLSYAAESCGEFFGELWDSIRKGFRPALNSALNNLPAALFDFLVESAEERNAQPTADKFEIPEDAYQKMVDYVGKWKADDLVEELKNGEMSVEQFINQSDAYEAYYNETRGHGDVDDRHWQEFEEGKREF